MAQSATIFKADIQISDMDRNYYASHNLTIARHPSETDLRMMLRLLAFTIHADEQLQFTKGISTDDEPDLWNKSLSGEIDLWIDLGTPGEKRIKKACGLSKKVALYTYYSRSATVWWDKNKNTLQRFNNLAVYFISDECAQQLTSLAQRKMQLQVTVQDGDVYFGDASNNIAIERESWN
jgi:uncharacterized protein YaeQ|tara:strand:+ start:4753 stop:5289 length:537 start_codon:yes stop_codon:yes gene_type:complete